MSYPPPLFRETDETLLKRAVYHYRQNLPEKTCSIYRDRTRG